MQNFHLKSVLLGAGIGVILTATVGLIYSFGVGKSLTKQQVITEAKKHGLRIAEEGEIIVPNPKESDNSVKINNKLATPKEELIKTPVPTTPIPTKTPVPTLQQTMTIYVVTGDTPSIVAGKLQNANLIRSREEFINALKDSGLEYNINIGEYKFKIGTSVYEIIRVLTTNK